MRKYFFGLLCVLLIFASWVHATEKELGHPLIASGPETETEEQIKEAKAKLKAEESKALEEKEAQSVAQVVAEAEARAENEILESGESLRKEENFSAELKRYGIFLRSHPKSIRVILAQGTAYMRLKKYSDAQRCFHKVRKLDSSNLQSWLKELAALRLQGAQKQEKALALEIIARFPEIKDLPFLKKFQG